ncbi:CAP domain-containing protein [Paludisphaera mucosa]|uniref:CAP domain-containing protein n=1 Tax=Paludisphaera mucosa TaxID=3030827 RepID=A0ABT6F7M1_9BACT|nr:CAP domain-containing protein [Paludisphaera mucosa]MDG3003527.1 CAP domain-containing protein [Paludisphaera mucosa]
MSKLHSPWILTLLFAAASSSASAQDAGSGPISRLVGRLRQPSHQHHHVHTQPTSPAYTYNYAQAQSAVAPQVASVAQQAEPVAPSTETAEQEAADAAAPVAEAAPASESTPVADPATAAEPAAAYTYATTGDPYGFMSVLNRIRASAGLHPLAYDSDLSSWAHQNNAEQCRRGLGHHVNPSGIQNCAYNYTDADSTAAGWMNSPGHRRNLLSPSATHFGIAFGPGPYWTLNAR